MYVKALYDFRKDTEMLDDSEDILDNACDFYEHLFAGALPSDLLDWIHDVLDYKQLVEKMGVP